MRRGCIKGLWPVGALALWLLAPVDMARGNAPEAPATEAGATALERAAAAAPNRRPPNASSGTSSSTSNVDEHKTVDPIHIISGSVEQYEVDLEVACPLVDLTFHRVYHSAHASSGDLGPRWHHSYGWALEALTITNAPDRRPWAIQLSVEPVVSKYIRIRALADPNQGALGGDYHWFRETLDGYSTLDNDDRYRLEARAGGGWTLHIPGGLEYRFGRREEEIRVYE